MDSAFATPNKSVSDNCGGTLVCQSVICQSLMSYWFYRIGFEIGSCFSYKRSNDSH